MNNKTLKTTGLVVAAMIFVVLISAGTTFLLTRKTQPVSTQVAKWQICI